MMTASPSNGPRTGSSQPPSAPMNQHPAIHSGYAKRIDAVGAARSSPHFDAPPGRALVARVKSALQASPYFRGRLNVLRIQSPDNRKVTLCGRLPTFYLKQILQTIVLQVEGVEELENDVEVNEPCPGDDPDDASRD